MMKLTKEQQQKIANEVPECMSPVIGSWINGIQDEMPSKIRNSPEWRRLLALAAATGRDYEPERMAIIVDWVWSTFLPSIQQIADDKGFGSKWREMIDKKTEEAKWAGFAAWTEAERALEATNIAEAKWAEAERAAWEKIDPAALLSRLVAVTDHQEKGQ